MGAQAFTHEVVAKNAKEAFLALVEDADQEYGTRSYNGSINTCQMGSCKKTFDICNKENLKKAYEFIDEKDNGSKWTADYIKMGVDHYELYETKKESVTPNVKYELQYCVHEMFRDTTLAHSKTKKEAVEIAEKMALKNGVSLVVDKEYVAVSGNARAAKITVKKTELKTAPKKLKDNTICEPFYRFIFYGWASC